MASCSRSNLSPAERRARFPNGLIQAEGSQRFGLDALLLAALALAEARKWHADPSRPPLIVELGSGCGAALLAIALDLDGRLLGVELEARHVAAARQNASLLDARHIQFVAGDLGQKGFFRSFPAWAGKCRLVLANPPWWRPGESLHPNTSLKLGARCAQPETLALFCRRASGFLAARGRFCCILPPKLMCAFCAATAAVDLGLRLVWPVHSHAEEAAKRLLLVCGKNMQSDPVFHAPLVLHESGMESGAPNWTQAAREFMPWLGSLGEKLERSGKHEFCG